ncbi:Reverse transcriptase domain [Trinorchestia longiramus]|nr:Reverse transcriptase domain [Trinorchestia longiramus]
MLGVTVDTPQGPITIDTTYIPPRINYINYIDMHTLLRWKNHTYLLADMNAQHPTLGYNYTNMKGKQIHALINKNKCIHIGPNFPTLLTHNYSTSPDIVLTNTQTFHNIRLQPGPLTPSDHTPIIATITANPIQIPIRPRPSFHNADWTQYKSLLTAHTVPQDPQPTLEEIDNHLSQLGNSHHRSLQPSNPNHHSQNNPGNQTNTRNTAARNKIPSHLQPPQETRTLSSLVLQTRKPQTPNKTNRTHWSNIYSGVDDPDNKFDENHIHDVETQMTNITPHLKPHETGDITRLNTPQFPAITLQELQQALRTFSQKAPGHSKITTHYLKQLPPNMLQYLLYIFNNAISAGYFPIKLKHTIMIFLPKPSTSQHEIKNYRPISLLDIHGKLLDKIFTYRLTNHLTMHNIYNKRQHGFRHGRGTHTALATLHETLHSHLNQRNKVDVILRDVSKVFDKAWHTGLKHKLSQLNIDPLFTKILTNFLSDRTAAIRIANPTVQSFPIKSGVPQGALISPALYIFYTHDLPSPTPNTDYIAFPDDLIQITFSPNSHNMVARLTTRAIGQINAYERKLEIQTNANKFKLIAISHHKKHEVHVDGNPLPYDKSSKVLGLHLGSQGYTSHITEESNSTK